MVTSENCWRAFGRLAGFPTCCIEAFEADCCADTKKAYPLGPWVGSGFIPCKCCAFSANVNFAQFVDENIAPRRFQPTPFPQQWTDEEGDRLLDSSFGAWLVALHFREHKELLEEQNLAEARVPLLEFI